MFQRKSMITGLFSAILLGLVATPASATDIGIRFDLALDRLVADDGDYRDGYRRHAREYEEPRYNDRVPARRINRQLRRRGLYAVSDFRVKRNRVIFRAENRRGSLYKVVASLRSGSILNLRRIGRSADWQPYARPDYSYGEYETHRRNSGRIEIYRNDWNAERPRYREKRLKRKDRTFRKKARRNNRDIRKIERRNAKIKKNKQSRKLVVKKTPRKIRKPYIDKRFIGQTPDERDIMLNGSLR